MACCSSATCATPSVSPTYRKVLWSVLAINFVMFLVEIVGGMASGSTSLLSDSMDFFGDAANYGVSLFVLGSALSVRAKASLLKGYTMGVFGVAVLAMIPYRLWLGKLPDHEEMTVIGFIALLANVVSAVLLYRFREGDSNMRSVWLCSRNDAVGNILVVVAAGAVYLTQSNLPDLIVSGVMAYLAISAAAAVVKQAKGELQGETKEAV